LSPTCIYISKLCNFPKMSIMAIFGTLLLYTKRNNVQCCNGYFTAHLEKRFTYCDWRYSFADKLLFSLDRHLLIHRRVDVQVWPSRQRQMNVIKVATHNLKIQFIWKIWAHGTCQRVCRNVFNHNLFKRTL